MEYRIKADELTRTLQVWDELMPGRRKIRLVACGGTALTLMGCKESTKDVDFLVPDPEEYHRLVDFLTKAGYQQVTQYGWKRDGETILFDLYPGKKVYVTELLTSPLARGGSQKWKAWNKIEVLVLNPTDLIISKMFRGTEVDIQDCLLLLSKEKLDLEKFKRRYRETAQYEIGEAKVLRNLEILLKRWQEVDSEKRK
ncbi:MAG: hypothetical protein A2351_01345 [Omnitrophica bacterium RIFOXYB12_FULL_50_7]|nr:MAG: hypothetical protein A2351_01345 [Omnitrophica bacterium RIFOXYB12_FULL_50_7]